MMANSGLHWFDWVVLGGYALAVVALGFYAARGQTSAKTYFVSRGSLGTFAIGFSLFASLMSTSTYLSLPGELIKNGPVILIGGLAGLLAYPVVCYWIIPRLVKRQVVSVYELIEVQLGLGARLLAAAMFVILRLMWMAALIYMGSKALAVIVGLPDTQVPFVAAIVGLVAIVYTSMGGLRAVVVTDTVQFFLLFGGAALTVIVVTWKLGSFEAWWPSGWMAHWDPQPVFSWDPHVRVTVVGTVASMFTYHICSGGADQVMVQRYMSSATVAAARRSYLIYHLSIVAVYVLLALVGVSVLAFFQKHHELVAGGGDIVREADHLFPLFISTQLPIGISGLVVAGMFAAAMSSIDSGVNSITAVVMTDFLDRFGLRPRSARSHVRAAQLLAFAIGVMVVGMSVFVDRVPGNFLELGPRTANLLMPGIFSLVFLALFVPFVTARGAIVGVVAGVATGVLIAYWDFFFGAEPLSFQWIAVASLVVNLVVACLISLWKPRRSLIGEGQGDGKKQEIS
jgi:SSS family solute:Na+ symporter